ncbi:MAG TPA: WD40 repeat domain-containing protein, partial [Elusimicrobiota bacterium]|nr:WD40 repeat domain-containing protein [Elusimicrobiota bacterium]
LEKDRTRRYETANGLAMDLKRHLNNETVVARPPSKLYEFQKTYRRHKVGFAATAAIIAVLTAGVLVSSWEAARAIKAKSDAETARGAAVKAQAGETRLREQAEADALAARQRAYASDMNVAMEALDADKVGRVIELLNRQRPQPGEKDLRGWEWRYLWGQTRSDALYTLCQESGEINSLAVSPDGLSLAVGNYHRGGVSLWDLRTRRMEVRLSEDAGAARAAFSPTEPLLAYAATDSSGPAQGKPTLHLWNTATRQTVADVPLDDTRCEAVVFSKDGRTLLTATALVGPGGHIALWNPNDGSKIATFPTESSSSLPATAFAVTPDFSLAAYTFGPPTPGKVRVLDMRSGRELWTADAAEVFVTALAFSPDGKILASGPGFADHDIRLWDVATGKELGRLDGHRVWVSSLLFSSDGTKLFSSSADQTIRVWDVATRQCTEVLRGHRQEVWRLAGLPDGKTIVSGGKDGAVCFWDTSTPPVERSRITISDDVITWVFAPDSRSLLTLNRKSEIKRWAGRGFSRSETVRRIGTTLLAPVSFFKFSDDGSLFAGRKSNGMAIMNVERGIIEQRWTNSAGPMTPFCFTADQSRLISAVAWGGADAMFQEWDLKTAANLQTWRLPGRFQEAVGISPDESSCVAFNYDGDGILRNLAEQRTTNLDFKVTEAASVSYSPDGKLLAIGSDLGFARIVDAATFHPLATLGGYLLSAHTVAFSPDGKRLALGSEGRYAVTLFDTESWQNVLTLDAESTDFHGVRFSPDGNTLGWLSQIGELNIWQAPSWTEINAAEERGKAPSTQP